MAIIKEESESFHIKENIFQFITAGELRQPDQVFDPAGNWLDRLWRHLLPTQADCLRQGAVQLHPLPSDEE